MNDYSAYQAAKENYITCLVIHDKDDPEVPVKAGNTFTSFKNDSY
jgi:hypothetical protein